MRDETSSTTILLNDTYFAPAGRSDQTYLQYRTRFDRGDFPAGRRDRHYEHHAGQR